MQFTVVIEQDQDGWFLGSVPALYGCRTQAETLPQLYERLEEVIQLCLEEKKPENNHRFVGVQQIEIPAYV